MTETGNARFVVRRCGADDGRVVAELGARLFIQAFGYGHPEPDRSIYLRSAYDPDTCAREIGDGIVRAYLAEDADGVPAGLAVVQESKPPSCVAAARPLEILRFYVDERWHGAGVAAALMRACEADARDAGADIMWLKTWEEALRAHAYYRKTGFAVVGRTQFHFGTRVDNDYVFARQVPSAGPEERA